MVLRSELRDTTPVQSSLGSAVWPSHPAREPYIGASSHRPPGKNEMIVRTPEHLMIANDLAKDAAAAFRSLPDFVSLSGCGIRDTDGPGLAGAPGF